MRLGCILVLIGVLFASSRAYIQHTSPLMRMNAFGLHFSTNWSVICIFTRLYSSHKYFNAAKCNWSHFEWVLASQYALSRSKFIEKHTNSHSNEFKLQSIATSSVIWILTHLYSLDKYINVLYMQLSHPKQFLGSLKCANVFIINSKHI